MPIVNATSLLDQLKDCIATKENFMTCAETVGDALKENARTIGVGAAIAVGAVAVTAAWRNRGSLASLCPFGKGTAAAATSATTEDPSASADSTAPAKKSSKKV
jgi:hypothetical protein